MKETGISRIQRAIRFGDVTDNGIAFEWGLAGMEGAWFTLLPEDCHTALDVEKAKKELRSQRDVVTLRIERIK